MVKVASLFGQLLGHVSRVEFEGLVKKTGAEKAAKGFRCWSQLVAMLFCHMGRADSLREICNGLACCQGKLTHLGVAEAPKKSTLAYANEHRPAVLFEQLFFATLGRLRGLRQLGLRKAAFGFSHKLLSLDSTTISLCLSLFPWARYRQAKGGVKVHVLLDHDDYMPAWVLITDARQHDVRAARLLQLPEGSIVVEDRGYCDYTLFGGWTRSGVFFVTRLKSGASYEVVETRAVPGGTLVQSDEIIRLSGPKASEACPQHLRRVVVWDEVNEREFELLTNHLEMDAPTIGLIYKDRWEIELFFKALKQNLKVKTFVGTSENALRVQIWTALLALLLLKWLHHLSTARWSFATLAVMLRLNLFTYRDLAAWLDDPYNTPPQPPGHIQQELPFGRLGQPLTAHAR